MWKQNVRWYFQAFNYYCFDIAHLFKIKLNSVSIIWGQSENAANSKCRERTVFPKIRIKILIRAGLTKKKRNIMKT